MVQEEREKAMADEKKRWVLNRNEKLAMMYMVCLTSTLAYAQEDMKDRYGQIEGGTEMMNNALDWTKKIMNALFDTIPDKQVKNIWNTANECEMRMMPKFTPNRTDMLVDKETLRELIDAAHIKCRECVNDSDEAKKCKIYELSATLVPLEEYPDGGLCPYSLAEWE